MEMSKCCQESVGLCLASKVVNGSARLTAECGGLNRLDYVAFVYFYRTKMIYAESI